MRKISYHYSLIPSRNKNFSYLNPLHWYCPYCVNEIIFSNIKIITEKNGIIKEHKLYKCSNHECLTRMHGYLWDEQGDCKSKEILESEFYQSSDSPIGSLARKNHANQKYSFSKDLYIFNAKLSFYFDRFFDFDGFESNTKFRFILSFYNGSEYKIWKTIFKQIKECYGNDYKYLIKNKKINCKKQCIGFNDYENKYRLYSKLIKMVFYKKYKNYKLKFNNI